MQIASHTRFFFPRFTLQREVGERVPVGRVISIEKLNEIHVLRVCRIVPWECKQWPNCRFAIIQRDFSRDSLTNNDVSLTQQIRFEK